MKRSLIHLFLVLFLFLTIPVLAQIETLSNKDVILMTQAGLSRDLIVTKIRDTGGDYDISAAALIELKKSGVADEAIAAMMEKAGNQTPQPQYYSENVPPAQVVLGPKEALQMAKTVAIEKSSLHPSRQALEKALLKRADWKKFDLNLVRIKDDADLYIEIGRIPFTWLTHRYVFRIYDRRSGTIITAGETTSWGSLAENMAREIVQKLNDVAVR